MSSERNHGNYMVDFQNPLDYMNKFLESLCYIFRDESGGLLSVK